MQYSGWRASCDGGGTAHYLGEQKATMHYICEYSGAAAHDALNLIRDACEGGAIAADILRCTRIDLQRTRMFPGWSTDDQQRIKAAARANGLTNADAMSNDREYGELSTVYIGSQKSGRFMRVYQKVVRGEVWLRCEVVYRHGGGSDNLFQRICSYEPNYTIDNAYCGAVTAVKIPELSAMFEPDARPEMPRVAHEDSKTVKWLTEQVLPSFKRVVSQHDGASHQIATLFLECLRQCQPTDGWQEDSY